ncbi:MAG: hypothetical protein OXJ37_01675 [Bryobacterales bacterium]|nr:hypothetical protein [Bryobacterales bacterium]
MLLTSLVAVTVPMVVSFARLVARERERWTEARGIALQTVIVMVVLLAIAGGVAAVLLTRGSEATTELEQQQVTVDPSRYTNKTLCEAAGNTWTWAAATATNPGDAGSCA